MTVLRDTTTEDGENWLNYIIQYDTIHRLHSETDRTCQFSLVPKNEKFMKTKTEKTDSPRNKPIMG